MKKLQLMMFVCLLTCFGRSNAQNSIFTQEDIKGVLNATQENLETNDLGDFEVWLIHGIALQPSLNMDRIDQNRSALVYVWSEGEVLSQYFIPFDLDFDEYSTGMFCGCCHIEQKETAAFGQPRGIYVHCEENCTALELELATELKALKPKLEEQSQLIIVAAGEHP